MVRVIKYIRSNNNDNYCKVCGRENMKKKLSKLIVSVLTVAMIMPSLPVNMLSVQATELQEETLHIEGSVSDADINEELLLEEDFSEDSAVEKVDRGRLQIYSAAKGTIGTGFTWNYDEKTKTLTITGEGTGLLQLIYYLPESISENAKKIVFQDCIVSGSVQEMLYNFIKVETVEFDNFDTSNVTDMSGMFSRCSSLSKLDVSGFDTSKVTDMSSMFNECSNLSELDVSGFNTSKVTDMSSMFNECNGLSELDVSGFDTSRVTNMGAMFSWCGSLNELDVSGFNTSRVMDMGGLFYGCGSLGELDVSGFDTSRVTDMSGMFYGCSSLNGLNVRNFDTKNVVSIYSMFSGCSSLSGVDVSNFDTGNVTNMESMFESCKSLSKLDVSNFDTGNVTNMSYMFLRCDSLNKLDLSNFDTGKVTGMEAMFSDCKSLSKLDVSSFDTGKVTSMEGMFSGCKSLSSLDLSSFNIGNVQYTGNMFKGCSSLITIKTPKVIAKGMSIDLPVGFYDSQMNRVKAITPEHSNKILTKNNAYTITYRLAGGKNHASNPATYTKTSATITLKTPTRKGYTFKGWYSDSKLTKKVTQIKKGSSGNVTLYAKWTANKYTVKYNKNGGKGTMKAVSATYGKSFRLATNTFRRTGYTFKGWSTKKNGKVVYTNKDSVKNLTAGKSITLYAKWTPNQYTVKFNGNGATSGNMSSLLNRKYGASYKLPVNAYKKTGYEFVGWNTKKNGTGKSYKNRESVKNLVSTNGKSITLYAQWKKK